MFSNDILLLVQCILKYVYFYIQYKWEKNTTMLFVIITAQDFFFFSAVITLALMDHRATKTWAHTHPDQKQCSQIFLSNFLQVNLLLIGLKFLVHGDGKGGLVIPFSELPHVKHNAIYYVHNILQGNIFLNE